MKKKYFQVLLIGLMTIGCNQQKSTSQSIESEQISIQSKQFYAPYCIYILSDEDSITTKMIQELTADLLPKYQLVDSLSDTSGSNELQVAHFSNPKEDMTPPDIDYLQHSAHGLSIEEMEQLQNAKKAVVLTFSGTNEDIIADNIQLNQIIHALIPLNKAVVTDFTTYESFNKTSWNTDRVLNFSETNHDITSQFTIHIYRDQGFCRAVTLGMGKFCLPDISLEGISCRDGSSYGSLINLLSQTWLEKPTIGVDSTTLLDIDKVKNDSVRSGLVSSLVENASRKGIVNLKSVIPQEGDGFNTQLQIVFEDQQYSSPQEEQLVLLSSIFGSSDEIDYIEHNNEILAASQRAKEKLPRFQKLFNDGLAPGYSLLLKAPFETDEGGNEWMWIEVSKWENDRITGILQNDPFDISDLAAGAIVEVNQSDIFDYIYYLPNGSSEGNETGVIISGEK